MDLLELQQRANVLVDKVNQYEENLTGLELDENQVLNQHTYVDIFCLRPVLKLLFGKDVSDKLSRTLENDIELPLVSSTAPAWNTFFNFFNQEVTSNQHEFIQNIDTYNSSNMLMLDTQQYTLTDRDTAISLGIRYSYGANIGDALVTESQVANLFNWNTTNDTTVLNNTKTTNRQVPGIVLYYLGNDYNGVYTATIPYSIVQSNINTVNDNNPPLYGAYYDSSDITKSQVGLDMGAECCRIFIPGCNYLGGKLISPQQIWQPDRKVGDDNIGYGYNWQGKAVYHELVFKNRRSGCSDNGVDFIPGLDSVPDNDPQGLATRLILAQMKNYYYNRPWFNDLNSLHGVDTSKLVNEIKNTSRTEYTTHYTKVGNPTISDDFVMTGANLSNYLNCDFNPPSTINSFIFEGEFTVSDNAILEASRQPIFGQQVGVNNRTSPQLEVLVNPDISSQNNNQIAFLPPISSSDWGDTIRHYITDISKFPGTWYYKYTFDKQSQTVIGHIENLTNGYKPDDITISQSVVYWINPLSIGADTKANYTTNNISIDLKSFKVNINDSVINYQAVTSQVIPLDDEAFFKTYKLDYNTFADALNLPK